MWLGFKGKILQDNYIDQLKRNQRIRKEISDDMHDDIKSTLSSIRILSDAMKMKPLEREVREVFKTISGNADKVLSHMRDLIWSVDSDYDSLEQAFIRMRILATQILEPLGVDIVLELPEEEGRTPFFMKKRKEFFLIYKEAVTNCAKYADAGKVEIVVARRGNHLELTVKDDGKGFDPGAEFNGLGGKGLKSMQRRADKLQGELKIRSVPGKGTEVRLRFSIP